MKKHMTDGVALLRAAPLRLGVASSELALAACDRGRLAMDRERGARVDAAMVCGWVS